MEIIFHSFFNLYTPILHIRQRADNDVSTSITSNTIEKSVFICYKKGDKNVFLSLLF